MELPIGTTVFPGNSIMNMPDNSGMWMITTAGVNFWDAEQDRFYNKNTIQITIPFLISKVAAV